MKEKNIRELAKRMGLVTVEDMCQYTIAQLVVKIANKVNELINEVWRFESDVQEILKTQNENIQYLLGEGLHLEVENVFDGWLQDGTFDTLINQSALKEVKDRMDETNAQLSEVDDKVKVLDAKDHNDVKLIGHRGFSYLFPEQTIETLHQIKRFGNVGIEVDLRTTADGEIILMHDETIDRTTNGTGNVSSLTLEQIKKFECGGYFDSFYEGAKVPTLEEFLQNAKWCNFIVLQINAVSLESLEKVVSLIEKYNMIDSCYIYTVGEYGQRQHFDKLYELNHKIKRIYRPNRNDADDVKNFKESKGVRYFIEWSDTLLKNPGLVKEYGDLGIEVMASTTETKEKYTELNKLGISKCLAETVWEV